MASGTTAPQGSSATAALPPGSNPRAFGIRVGSVELDNGHVLPDVVVAVQTWGRLHDDRSNAVLVEHALTGDSHVVGPSGPGQPTEGWWDGVVGPGQAIDTERHFVVCTNVLGGCRGTTGPTTPGPDGRPWGSRFPRITIRDQVRVEAAVADALGIDRWQLVVGGSMGGMRSLEWACTYPDRVESVAVLASTATATADQIAWGQAQVLAIESDPDFCGGDYLAAGRRPVAGLGIARRIAHTTYRSADELNDRFGRSAQGDEDPLTDGRFSIESYLDHHAGKLVGRFDAGSYLALTRAMASHDVGRGRGGVEAALAAFSGRLLVVAVDSDRLFPPSLSEQLAAAHPDAELVVVRSPYGHDGFLVEAEQVSESLRPLLAGHRPGRCRVG